MSDVRGWYTAHRLTCKNCGWGGKYVGKSLEIRKGQTIIETACPTCGCKTLRKTNGV